MHGQLLFHSATQKKDKIPCFRDLQLSCYATYMASLMSRNLINIFVRVEKRFPLINYALINNVLRVKSINLPAKHTVYDLINIVY